MPFFTALKKAHKYSYKERDKNPFPWRLYITFKQLSLFPNSTFAKKHDSDL